MIPLLRKELTAVFPYHVAIALLFFAESLSVLVRRAGSWSMDETILWNSCMVYALFCFAASLQVMASEARDGTLDLLDSLPVGRTRIYLAKVLAVFTLPLAAGLVSGVGLALHAALEAPVGAPSLGTAALANGLSVVVIAAGSAGLGLGLARIQLMAWPLVFIALVTLSALTQIRQEELPWALSYAFEDLLSRSSPWPRPGVTPRWLGLAAVGVLAGSLNFATLRGRGVSKSSKWLARILGLACGLLLCLPILRSRAALWTLITRSPAVFEHGGSRFLLTTDAEPSAILDRVAVANAMIREQLQIEAPIRIDIEVAKTGRMHAGEQWANKVRISPSAEDAPVTLVHELVHAHVGHLAKRDSELPRAWWRFFDEGLATYLGSELTGDEDELPKHREWAGYVSKLGDPSFERLTRASADWDDHEVYPLGLVFVEALLEEAGPSAPSCVARGLAKVEARTAAEAWSTLLKPCGTDLPTLLQTYHRVLRSLEPDFVHPFPRLATGCHLDQPGVISDLSEKGSWLVRFAPAHDTADHKLETVSLSQHGEFLPYWARGAAQVQVQVGQRLPRGAQYFGPWQRLDVHAKACTQDGLDLPVARWSDLPPTSNAWPKGEGVPPTPTITARPEAEDYLYATSDGLLVRWRLPELVPDGQVKLPDYTGELQVSGDGRVALLDDERLHRLDDGSLLWANPGIRRRPALGETTALVAVRMPMGHITLLDGLTGMTLRVLEQPGVKRLGFRGETLLAVTEDARLLAIAPATGSVSAELDLEAGEEVEIVPGGHRVVTLRSDGTAVVQDTATGRTLHRIEDVRPFQLKRLAAQRSHWMALSDSVWSPDGERFSLPMKLDEAAIVPPHVYDYKSRYRLEELFVTDPPVARAAIPDRTVWKSMFLDRGQLLAANSNAQAFALDLDRCELEDPIPASPYGTLWRSPKSALLGYASHGEIRALDARGRPQTYPLVEQFSEVGPLADGTGWFERSKRWLDAHLAGRVSRRFEAPAEIDGLAADGESIYYAYSTVEDASIVGRWDLRTDTHQPLFTARGTILSLALSPDGRWLSFHDWDGLHLFDTSTGEPRWVQTAPQQHPQVSDAGHVLAWSTRGQMVVRHPDDGRLLAAWPAPYPKRWLALPGERVAMLDPWGRIDIRALRSGERTCQLDFDAEGQALARRLSERAQNGPHLPTGP